MADREIIGGVDTWVGQIAPSANHNGANYGYVHDASGNNAYFLLFIQAPAPVKAGTSVLEATLKLHLKFASVGTIAFSATPLAADWKAGKVTWNNMPGVKSSGVGAIPATDSLTGAGPDDIVNFDVGLHLQEVADGGKWYGWRIETTTAGAIATIFGTEAGKEWRRPRLEVTWSNAPAPPTDLAPSGGRFISTGAPILRYTYADFGGNTELVAQQIQVEDLDALGEPTGTVFDTGAVPTSEPEFDLATSTFTALVDGEAARWRVKVQDGAGLWSEWSDWASFERLNKGTLVIDSPAAPPNDFVQEVTPPILWTHTGGGGQEAFQVIIQQQGLGGFINIYSTGKKSGDDSSWTLPKGVLTRANWSDDPGGGTWDVPTVYKVVVRTWDGQGRERTPGDPVYYQAEREFTVKEGVTANVTGLTVVAESPYPWATLTWQRATAPDAFNIVRGGDVFETVDPADVFVSGTTYSFTDKMAIPNREHTWAVLPVVNGVMATVESMHVTTTIRSRNMWLTNPDRDNSSAVMIVGEGRPAFDATMEDQGETYEIVGGSKRIRVTNALMGYAGTISGQLLSDAYDELEGISARDWSDRMLDFKAEPGARLILTLSDMAIPVVIFHVTVRPTQWVEVREVEFEFIEDRIPRFVEAP